MYNHPKIEELTPVSKELAEEAFGNFGIYYILPNNQTIHLRCYWDKVDNHWHQFPDYEDAQYFIRTETYVAKNFNERFGHCLHLSV